MAQVQQKTPPSQGKTVAKSTADSATPTSGSRPRFQMPSLRALTGPDGPIQKGSAFRRLIIASFILIVGLSLIQLLIGFVYTHLSRGAQDALQQPLASKDTFLLGGLNGVNLILIICFGALYIALIRFNIIPRDPLNQRAKAQARVAASRPTNSSINLSPQTRASRRQAAATAATTANAKNGKNASKTSAPIMKAKAGQSGAKPELAAARSGAHDLEYERVKALQRQQRRREAKR